MSSLFCQQVMAKALYFNCLLPRLQLKGGSIKQCWSCAPCKASLMTRYAEARSIGMSAASVADVFDEELRLAKFQLLFGSAEKIIEKKTMPPLTKSNAT